MRAPLLLLTVSLAACQPSVEGWWSGGIGQSPRTLRLEQTGSSLAGEICTPEACVPVRGDIDDDWVDLDYGCATCALPEAELHLQMTDGRLDGDATELGCACGTGPAGCACRSDAHFVACDGPC